MRRAVNDSFPMGSVLQNDVACIDDDIDRRQNGEKLRHDENDLLVPLEDFFRLCAFGEKMRGFQLADVLVELLMFRDEIEEDFLFVGKDESMLLRRFDKVLQPFELLFCFGCIDADVLQFEIELKRGV